MTKYCLSAKYPYRTEYSNQTNQFMDVMMTNYKTISLIVASALIYGCGDSDSSAPGNPAPPDGSAPKYDNLQVDVTPDTKLDQEIAVYMGPWFPCSTRHLHMCLDPSKAKPIEQNSEYDANNKMTANPEFDEFKVSGDELKKFAAETGKIPVDKTIFAPGQFSVLDVMVYMSETRDDFEMVLGEYDPTIATYPFTVSYDFNHDGKFSEEDGADYYQNPDWYGSTMYTDGEWKRMVGTAGIEPLYARLEEYLVRNDTHLRFRAFHPSMTERRRELQAKEVARLQETGGKVILPEFRVNFDDGRGFITIAKDLEVTPHNLRPDLFQPGVITLADILMSVNDQGFADIEFTYWPTLSTKAEIHSYAVSSINGKRAGGWKGWFYKSGEIYANEDFFWSPFFPTAQMLIDADMADSGDHTHTVGNTKQASYSGRCHWLIEDGGTVHSPETAQICIDNWFGAFGGNNIHQMSDIAVMRYPKEALTFYWHTHMQKSFQVSQANMADDGQGEVFDISRAVAPLTQDHFGWGVADCGTCHSLDETHVTGDAPHLPDLVQPHYCASCHGNNGAPDGHGEQGRCFWCHSEDKVMVNHGDASKRRPIDEVGCSGTTMTGYNLEGQSSPCADRVIGVAINAPVTRERNVFSYEELLPNLSTLGNSDWNTSETFPDPYSCVTCHPED